MNDAVILLCGVILLLAVLPMFLMGRAFKGAGSKKPGAASARADSAAGDGKAAVDRHDSGRSGGSGGKEGQGGGT